MTPAEAKRLFSGEPVVRFGMVGQDDRPCVVPVTATVIDDDADGVVVFAVDPTTDPAPTPASLAAGIHRSACVTFLADRCLLDGAPLWWVLADAVAEVLHCGAGDDPRFATALAALDDRFPHRRLLPEPEMVVWSTVLSWTGHRIGTQ